MITGTHAILYADDADAARAFLRDVLGLPNVDVGGGWLVFKLPPAELGVHPAVEGVPAGDRHELFLMCDDIDATVRDLTAKGVEFTGPVSDEGFGMMAVLRVPGAGELGIYQPKHAIAYNLDT
jgi:catechol 2,3-dioxygenase-like lactoylglutathione lyase family enzyme